jgi:hypothetical protein
VINSTPTTSNDTTTTIRHKGPCGRRVACWRPECRQAFGAYPSIEILADKAIAFCHRLAVPLDDPRLRAAS